MRAPCRVSVSRYPNGLRVGEMAVVPKSRVVGVFNVRTNRIKMLMDKMLAHEKVIDCCNHAPRQSLILLDTGDAILSNFTVHELWNDYCDGKMPAETEIKLERRKVFPKIQEVEQDNDSGEDT